MIVNFILSNPCSVTVINYILYQQMHIKCIKYYKLSIHTPLLHVSANFRHLQGEYNTKEFIQVQSQQIKMYMQCQFLCVIISLKMENICRNIWRDYGYWYLLMFYTAYVHCWYTQLLTVNGGLEDWSRFTSIFWSETTIWRRKRGKPQNVSLKTGGNWTGWNF
jgi:hypothetical protein